ncbi:galanin receptor type 1-like [Sinocyclocheilus anshuiensis]|uniref:galanin receptor type 1-like n=1 Tax=Sinocyclocheilus anshuiensis TaxID=1608454 RepID=UPI0007B8F4B0|nr:PREDICTED: galanin receptor type 1-like [Sinocyclocheilus anshuiensis]
MGLSRNETEIWTEEHMDTNHTTDTFGPEVVIVPVIFGCIFLLGIIGNTLVMIVIGKIKSRRSRSTTNIFILNLSIADLSFLLFCVPFQATIYSLPEWIFGAFLCKFVHYFVMVSMLVSIFTLVAMSVDRYIAVVLSKKSPCIRNRRNALIGVCVIWMLSFIFAVPVAQHQILMNHPKAPNSTFCWEFWTERVAKHTYKVTILVTGYLLPLVLITCCYAKVLYHLHKKMKNMSKKSERSKRKWEYGIYLCIT